MTFFRGAFGAVLLGWLLILPTVASAEVYDSFGQLLADHLVEKDVQNGGLISAFDYRSALDDPKTVERLASQRSVWPNSTRRRWTVATSPSRSG